MILGSATSHRYLDLPGVNVTFIDPGGPYGALTWVDICSNGTNWVIIGTKAPFTTTYYGISSDLVSWSVGIVGSGGPRAIAANSNGFAIITTGNPTTQGYFSSNGTTWSSVSLPSGSWMDIKADTTNFIALSVRPFGNGGISRSSNGTTWSSITTLPAISVGDWYNLTTNGSTYTITPGNPSSIPTAISATYSSSLTGPWLTSSLPNGGVWTGSTSNNSTVVSVAANQIGPPYAIGPLYNSAYSSDNGVTWNASTLQDNYLDVGSSAYYFLAVGQVQNTTTATYSVSSNGISWNTYNKSIRTKRVSSKGLSYTNNGNIFGGIEVDGLGVTKIVLL